MTTRKTPPTWPTETALAGFSAWVEGCTTLEQLQETADYVNLLGRVVKARHAALQAAAKAQAEQHRQLALDKVAQWRRGHVTIIGLTDEQRTKLEKGLDKALVNRQGGSNERHSA